jgi:hypothetical protein
MPSGPDDDPPGRPPAPGPVTLIDPPNMTTTSQPATPRWLVVLAWSGGPAAVYALLSLAHAALVERILSVDVGFGRSLAFWVGAIYLGLLGWGFLPARPAGWYARRPLVLGLVALGLVGLVACGAFTALWLASHWVAAIGTPVTASILVLVLAALGVLWLAGRDQPGAAPPA